MTFLSRAWRFPLLLAVLLVAMLVSMPPQHNGDVAEYSLVTIAFASHGSPDIRLDDIARAKQLLPGQSGPYQLLEDDMRANKPDVYPAFARGRDGKVYAVHFFGYPALAAIPFMALEAAGLPPFKCFQVVNLVAIFLLGLSLHRLFGSADKATLGLCMFMLSGGALYWAWSSPECLSAAALLAALVLYAGGAPLAGALLAGLAAQQNPTIVFFFGFAPLLHLLASYQPDADLRANLGRALQRRNLLALAAGAALFALPPLFNLWQFGVPNIIVKRFSDPGLISALRLQSFFFDLNQGMLIGIPAVLAAITLWGWRLHPAGPRIALALAGASSAFMLALAVPALAVLNWNSGAAGIMRYAFWSAMPFLFVLMWRLKALARWPLGLLAGVVLAQAACMVHATSYGYVEFSPLAKWVMQRMPSHYHPEPEIFAERLGGNDNYIDPDDVYVRKVNGVAVTTLYHPFHPAIGEALCGAGGRLAPDQPSIASDRGWRYIDGPVRCLK